MIFRLTFCVHNRYLYSMKFEWDSLKSWANKLNPHRNISFQEASEVFSNPCLTRVDNRKEYGEIRLITLGIIKTKVVLAVVHTDRSGTTRIISARQANKKEKEIYYEYLQSLKKAA